MPRGPMPVGYVRVAQEGTYGPTSWANVFYLLAGPAGGATLAQVMADAAANVSQLYVLLDLSRFSSNFHVTLCKIGYRDATNDLVRATIADAQTGSGGTGDQAAQACYLINWSTGDPRRGGKPRTYIPGVIDASLADEANLTSAAQSSMNTGLGLWLSRIAAGTYSTHGTTFELVEMSFVNGKVDRAEGVPFPVIAGAVNPVIATQRRRVDRLRA